MTTHQSPVPPRQAGDWPIILSDCSHWSGVFACGNMTRGSTKVLDCNPSPTCTFILLLTPFIYKMCPLPTYKLTVIHNCCRCALLVSSCLALPLALKVRHWQLNQVPQFCFIWESHVQLHHDTYKIMDKPVSRHASSSTAALATVHVQGPRKPCVSLEEQPWSASTNSQALRQCEWEIVDEERKWDNSQHYEQRCKYHDQTNEWRSCRQMLPTPCGMWQHGPTDCCWSLFIPRCKNCWEVSHGMKLYMASLHHSTVCLVNWANGQTRTIPFYGCWQQSSSRNIHAVELLTCNHGEMTWCEFPGSCGKLKSLVPSQC